MEYYMGKGAAFLAFTVGVGVGFFASRQYFSKKYQLIADEEIASVKETFARRTAKPGASSNTEKPITPKSTPGSTLDLKRGGTTPRTNYSTFSEPDPNSSVVSMKPTVTQRKPRVIPPEEFGEMDDYEQISLTYYSDKTLADDAGASMSDADIKKTIGEQALRSFGEYEPDSVFVRNDDLKCDYEILLDQRTYDEAIKKNPTLED